MNNDDHKYHKAKPITEVISILSSILNTVVMGQYLFDSSLHCSKQSAGGEDRPVQQWHGSGGVQCVRAVE